MGKENLLIRSGTAGTKLNGRKKYNKYYYFINTHKSFISLFSYGTEKNERFMGINKIIILVILFPAIQLSTSCATPN